MQLITQPPYPSSVVEALQGSDVVKKNDHDLYKPTPRTYKAKMLNHIQDNHAGEPLRKSEWVRIYNQYTPEGKHTQLAQGVGTWSVRGEPRYLKKIQDTFPALYVLAHI